MKIKGYSFVISLVVSLNNSVSAATLITNINVEEVLLHYNTHSYNWSTLHQNTSVENLIEIPNSDNTNSVVITKEGKPLQLVDDQYQWVWESHFPTGDNLLWSLDNRTLKASFDNPIQAIGFQIKNNSDWDYSLVYLNAYNQQNNLISSQSILMNENPYNGASWIGIKTDPNNLISVLELTTSTHSGYAFNSFKTIEERPLVQSQSITDSSYSTESREVPENSMIIALISMSFYLFTKRKR